MKIGSLFSGVAGLDRAVEAVTGATPAWFVEFDPSVNPELNRLWVKDSQPRNTAIERGEHLGAADE